MRKIFGKLKSVIKNKHTINVVLVLLSRVNLIATNAIIGILLARWLGASEYGKYAFLMSFVALLNLPASIGIPNLVLREVASELTYKNWSKLKGLLKWSILTIFILVIIIYVTFTLWFLYFPSEYTEKYGILLFVSLLLIPMMSYVSLVNSYIRGMHFIGLSQIPSFFKQISFVTILASIFFNYSKFVVPEAKIALAINVLCSFIALLVAIIILHKKLPKKIKKSKPIYEKRRWVSSSIPFAMILGLQIINNRADSLMLGVFRTSSEVAYYDIAMRAAELILFLQIAFNMAIAPTLSKLYSEGRMVDLSNLVTKAMRALFLFTIPVFLILFIYGNEIILFLFGKEYSASQQAFYILLYANCVNLLTGPCDLVLNMCKKEKVTARGVGMAAILNVCLNALLIPKYGIEGACIATATTTVVWNFSLLYLARLHVGIDTSIIGMKIKQKA